MKETWGMPQEDSRSAQPMSRRIEEWAERRMRNVSEMYVTKVDSNASLQESDPYSCSSNEFSFSMKGSYMKFQ